MIPLQYKESEVSVGKNKLLFIVSFVFSIILLFAVQASHFNPKVIALFMLVPMLGIITLNFEVMIVAFVVLLYAKISVLFYFLVQLFALPLLFSYMLTKNDKNTIYQNNPLLIPSLIFVFAMLPSLINVSSIFISLLKMMNFIFILLIAFVLGAAISSLRQIKLAIYSLIAVSAINAVFSIRYGLSTGLRSFGFVGVVYVDYVCVVMVLLAIGILLKKGNSIRLFYLFLLLFFMLSMFLTQTRNTILSLAATFIVLLAYLIRKSNHFGMKKRSLIYALVSTVVLFIGILAVVSIFAPEVLARLTEFSSSAPAKELKSKDDIAGVSSMVTRVMIWHTSFYAFMAHPIVGIGAYSFALESMYYYKIPTFIYRAFVEDLSPHITYLAVLTEMGILGFSAFIFFLWSTIKMSLKAVDLSRSNSEKYISLSILAVQIYIIFSMLMSDAWLWGLCASLWAFFIGLSLANYRILLKSRQDNASG